VSPDTSSLVAVVVAVCAVLVACAGVGLVLLAIRLTQGATRARERLVAASSVVRQDAPRVRERLALATGRIDRLREVWVASDQATMDLTGSLASARRSLVGLTQGRLAVLIRGAGIVSKVAQFALLWR
jgi:hypothetical protein